MLAAAARIIGGMAADCSRRTWLAAATVGLLGARIGRTQPLADARDVAAAPPAQQRAWVRDRLEALGRPRWLLLGEQHDADAHQALQAAVVQVLAEQGRLAALVLEMAERGVDTRGLAPDATEATAQAALQWNDRGWPWRRYGPVVMAAVRAGVPVVGGNLPRAAQREVMAQSHWDTLLPPPAYDTLLRAIDEGHCGQLPRSQWGPMARIQLARDDAMAATLLDEGRDGATVVLVAGQQHVRRDRGVPFHLRRHAPDRAGALHSVAFVSAGEAPATPHEMSTDGVWLTPATPPVDHCAAFRGRAPT